MSVDRALGKLSAATGERIDVRMPDGSIIRNIPRGTPKAEIERRWRSAQQAKPKAPPRQKGTGIKPLDTALDFANEALIGAGQGLYNLGAAFTDPIASMIAGPDAVRAAQKQRQQAVDTASRNLSTRPMPVARTAGQIASTILPVGAIRAPAAVTNAAPRLAPIVTRALQGAAGGAAVRDSDQSAAMPATVGAVANVALPVVGARLANTRAGQALLSKGGQFVDDVLVGNTPATIAANERAAQITQQAAGLGDDVLAQGRGMFGPPKPQHLPGDIRALGGEAISRAQRFERLGVKKPTTGMLTRDPTVWTRERNLQMLDEGRPVKDAILGVQDDLYNAAQRIAKGAPGKEATGRTVREIVEARNKRLGDEVSTLYTRAREQFGDQPVGDLDNVWTTMADPAWRNNPKFGSMNNQVTGLLKDFGVIDDIGNSTGKSLSLSQANELRKFIRNLGDSSDDTVLAARSKLIGALDEDVFSNVGDDAFRRARKAAAQRFSEFESGLVKKMAKDGMFDEALPRRIVQGGVSNKQIRELFKTLEAEGQPGKQAIEQIRKQVFADIVENPSAMMDDGTTATVNGKTLWNAFQRNKDRLKVVLGDDMFAQADDFFTAARDATVQPATASPNYSATAAMLMNQRPGLLGEMFAAPTPTPPGLLTRNATTIGAGVGGLLGTALGGPIGAGGGASGGAAVGKGIQSLANRRAQKAVGDVTAKQVQAAIDPATAAQALRMLEDESLDAATRASIIAWWDKTIGPYMGSAAAGLLPSNNQGRAR